MVSEVMKRAAAAAQKQQQEVANKPHRSAVLAGLEHIERWLSQQVREHKKDKNTSAETKANYAQISRSLEATREKTGEPVNIEARAKTKNTFYSYRAAVRWSALETAAAALRSYKKADNDAEKKQAYQLMLQAAADLVRYPADAQPGQANNAKMIKIAQALGDEVLEASARKKSTVAYEKKAPGKNDKLADANKIQKIKDWRKLIFDRLIEVKSPWLNHAAVSALTGCRPAEVMDVRIEQDKNGALIITIPGAKVTEKTGQPVRVFTIESATGPEFLHLQKLTKAGPLVLTDNGKKTPESAYSETLKRAGRQALGPKAPVMSGYVYRHAFACDMKADKATRDEIAAALGHAVTKTQAHYGRAAGGTKGARSMTISAEREIKQTHGTGHKTGLPPVPPPGGGGFDI